MPLVISFVIRKVFLVGTILQELTRDSDGKLEVNLKYPHYFPIMERCQVSQATLEVKVTLCMVSFVFTPDLSLEELNFSF